MNIHKSHVMIGSWTVLVIRLDKYIYIYPLVNIQKAIENGPVERVDLPINSMVIFQLVM